MSMYIYIFTKVFRFTEPYRVYILKSTMQERGLPGLRKQKKGLDIPKKTTGEPQHVKKEKRKKKKEGKRKKRSKQRKLACLG